MRAAPLPRLEIGLVTPPYEIGLVTPPYESGRLPIINRFRGARTVAAAFARAPLNSASLDFPIAAGLRGALAVGRSSL